MPSSLLAWVLLFCPVLFILTRRAFPIATLGLATGCQMVLWTMVDSPFIAMSVVLYSAAKYGESRGVRAAVLSSVTLVGFTLWGWALGEAPGYAVFLVALFAAATLLGMNSAARLAYDHTVLANTQITEERRLSEQERALVEERNRIARELHDVVAHGLSVMVVQASAGRQVISHNPKQAEQALMQIETTGRAALGEMRQVLKAIRVDPDDSWRPARDLGAINDLIEEFTQTGLNVTLVDSLHDAGEVPTTIGLTSYRIIREALTNVLKHAGPQASVRVVHAGEALLSPSVTRTIIDRFKQTERHEPSPPSTIIELDRLTEREIDVFTHMAQGLSNGEIADALYVSEATIKTHVGHILNKLHLRDRVQAVVLAYKSGWIGR